MKQYLDKIKAALARKDIVSHFAYYRIKDKRLAASDARMTVSTPCPYAGDFMVPGLALEKIAGNLKDDLTIELSENKRAHFKSGKFKAALPIMIEGAIDYRQPEGKWRAPPPTFVEALRKVRPFISDNAVHYWSLSTSLREDNMCASTNVSLAQVECLGLEGAGELLPSWAVDYIIDRDEDLEAMMFGEGYMAFMWADDTWMRAQLIDDRFPDIEKILALRATVTKNTLLVQPEWRSAFNTIAEMAPSRIEIFADKLVGIEKEDRFEFEIDSPVPEGSPMSAWNPKYLGPVVEIANTIQLDAWPRPATFRGDGFDGVVAGVVA